MPDAGEDRCLGDIHTDKVVKFREEETGMRFGRKLRTTNPKRTPKTGAIRICINPTEPAA